MGESPKLKAAMSDVSVVSPSDATLKCRIVQGEPPATVHWFHGTKEVYDGTKYEMSYDGDTASLTVLKTCGADGGVYRCEAANKMGRVDTEANLTVQCKYLFSFLFF